MCSTDTRTHLSCTWWPCSLTYNPQTGYCTPHPDLTGERGGGRKRGWGGANDVPRRRHGGRQIARALGHGVTHLIWCSFPLPLSQPLTSLRLSSAECIRSYLHACVCACEGRERICEIEREGERGRERHRERERERDRERGRERTTHEICSVSSLTHRNP